VFLKNVWYVGALADELGRDMLGRLILNEPVVFFRKEDGTPVALEDRCCHRRYPLHKGRLVGDCVECGYHGLTFDETGACIRVPGQELVPPSARVRSYPVVERYRWIWIWMGDPALADPDDITDFHWLDDDEWGAKTTRFHVKANYQLIVDNLLDLTHLSFVHQSTIGNMATTEAADVKFERDGDAVRVNRWMIDTPPPPTYVKAGGFKGNIDRWQIIEFTPPAFIRLYVGGAETGTGAPEGRRQGGIGMRNLNAITPEAETTCHYFWAQAHDFAVNDSAVTDLVFDQVRTAFLQDVDVFEAQQACIDLDPKAPEIDVNADAGGLQARRVNARLLEAENAAPPAMAKRA